MLIKETVQLTFCVFDAATKDFLIKLYNKISQFLRLKTCKITNFESWETKLMCSLVYELITLIVIDFLAS